MSNQLPFIHLGVPSQLAQALEGQGITTPTPIQRATLPDSIAGRDLLGRGRTGSGKTYAFLLPIVTRLMTDRYRAERGCPRTLILAPTRELVTQIDASLDPLKPVGKFTSFTIFGGVGQGPQVKAVQRGLDIAIATPGRLEDLMKQGEIDLAAVEMVVIDEADQMADMGFLPIVTKILDRIPEDAQHLLFSATLDAQVQILIDRYLNNPVTHHADNEEAKAKLDEQMEHHALRVAHEDKPGVIADLCAAPSRTIVFARTKHGARNLSRKLTKMGVPALELHGNLTQNARMRNLNAFHEGTITTLVATDIAARGIHVDDVELVIHADPPAEHKAYVHRSGRTARAGNRGVVVTIARSDQEKDVKSLMRKAGVDAQWANVTPESDLLFDLAPGGRQFMERADAEAVIRSLTGGGKPATSSAQEDRASVASRKGSKRSAGEHSPGKSKAGFKNRTPRRHHPSNANQGHHHANGCASQGAAAQRHNRSNANASQPQEWGQKPCSNPNCVIHGPRATRNRHGVNKDGVKPYKGKGSPKGRSGKPFEAKLSMPKQSATKKTVLYKVFPFDQHTPLSEQQPEEQRFRRPKKGSKHHRTGAAKTQPARSGERKRKY